MVKRIRFGLAGTGLLVLVLGAAVFAGSSRTPSLAKSAAVGLPLPVRKIGVGPGGP